MIYFTYNPNHDNYALLFKSDISTQELDKFFVQSQDIGIFPSSIGYNRKKGRTIDEKFGVIRRVSTSVNQNKIDDIENNFKGQVKYVEYDEWCKIAIATQKRYLENYNPSNEKDIREKSTNLLKELYDIKFLENEYTHTSLPVRADILAVSNNKEVITLEIKSDKDTFVRLEKQLKEYMNFSHIVYIALDISHLPKFLKKFNTYSFDTIGIMVYEDNEIYVFREPYKSSSIDVTALLWKDEYFQFLRPFSVNKSKFNLTGIMRIIKNTFTVNEFESISEQIFINRYLQNKEFKVDDLLDDIEYKNDKIKKLFKQ